MRKLYMTIAAFAALMFSQIGHATPYVPGATDIATNDNNTFYALVARDNGWHVDGYTASGAATGFTVQLTPNANVNPTTQAMVGLAFDGTSFHLLRDNLNSHTGINSYSALEFNTDGSYVVGSALTLGPSVNVNPTTQVFVGFDIAEEGYIALRNDLASTKGTDTWTAVGFDTQSGAYNGFSQAVNGAPSINGYEGVAVYNASPANILAWDNTQSVPVPGTGLLLGSIIALGFMRKRFAA